MEPLDELIFVSLEDWDDVWRRNQFICDGLARRHPGLRILFVEPAVDLSYALRSGDRRRLAEPRQRRVGPGGRVLCTRPWKALPNSIAAGRRLNERLLLRHARSVARRLGFRAPALWINAHAAGHLAGRLGERTLIYDVTDDWTAFGSPGEQALASAQDRALCRAADAVIVCSERLAELKRPLASHVHLIPNGVDAAHYARVSAGRAAAPPETTAWRRPVLGYTGSIHPERVDLELVEAIARRLPVTIALVGPVMLDDEARRRLASLGNVVLPGPQPYARIPEWMAAFDVCITPHLVTPFTESLNPIKLWEYLAAGKPIISTPVAGFRDFPEHVYLASDAEGFATALGTALSEGPHLADSRRMIAAQHSWESRIEAIEALLSVPSQQPNPSFLHV